MINTLDKRRSLFSQISVAKVVESENQSRLETI